jgi:hypothetical protein
VIQLSISPQKPLVILYPIGDEDVGYCNFILAPIVKNETNNQQEETQNNSNSQEHQQDDNDDDDNESAALLGDD